MDLSRDARWLLEEKHAGKETPAFAADCERLAAGEPLAYIIGSMPFLGLTIHLDSKPLIPRPETEWWVAELARKISEGSAAHWREFRVLDLCAGSGAIGCALLKLLPGAQVSFGEIDPTHEATIRKNLRENGLDGFDKLTTSESRADVRIGDLFEPFAGERFDRIVANPPYIPAGRRLPRSVADYEPALALYAGAEGLAIIERIAAELTEHLEQGAEAWVECDTEHAAEACARFARAGLSARILPDQYGAARVIVIS